MLNDSRIAEKNGTNRPTAEMRIAGTAIPPTTRARILFDSVMWDPSPIILAVSPWLILKASSPN